MSMVGKFLLFSFIYLCSVVGLQGMVIIHPATNECVSASSNESVILDSCTKSGSWEYTPELEIKVDGTSCLQAIGIGNHAKLNINCTDSGMIWELFTTEAPVTTTDPSITKYLSTVLDDGNRVCLDVDSGNVDFDGNIITNICKCFGETRPCDTGTQWFSI